MVDVLDIVASAAQTDWPMTRPLPIVTIDIRQIAGFGMLVPALTLFLLYLFRPRRYVLASMTAWIAASAMLLVVSIDSAVPGIAGSPGVLTTGRLAAATWAIAALVFGAGVRFSAVWFRAPASISPAFWWTAGVAAGWSLLAATFLGPVAAIVPAFVLMSAWQVKGALHYLRIAREQRFVGALLGGIGVAALVTVNATAALVTGSQGAITETSTNISYLNFLSVTLIVLGMHLLIFEDVIEELRKAGADLRQSRDEMVSLAVTDPLTGCYNRRFLAEIETHELHQHRRYGLPLTLLYIDIDRFKAINDTRGHETGDKVLQTIGTILRTQTRLADYVLRWGGDEFLVLLSTDEPNARVKAQNIRQAFLESAIARNLPDAVDLSIGCVFVPPDTEDLMPLIDKADRDMYRHRREMAG
jgi:diguanylate cyclase (GGDEF)-like protein